MCESCINYLIGTTVLDKAIIFVTGMDPIKGTGGGSSYIRSHGRAAQAAGYEPHIFCLSDRDEVVSADFGFVHRTYTPFRSRGILRIRPNNQRSFIKNWAASLVYTGYFIPFNESRLAKSIINYLKGNPGPHLIHGFHNWGCVGLKVREQLNGSGIVVKVINSFYTTGENEARLKLIGAFKSGTHLQMAFQSIEWLWIATVAAFYERRAYKNSDLVLVNYESVRRLFRQKHGAGAETIKCPYASEIALTGIAGPEGADLESVPGSAEPLILTVSRHDPRKGLDVLIRALAYLKKRGVAYRACLTSGGSMLESHKKLADLSGLTDLHFTGWVEKVAPYFKNADIFVLPSIQEGSGSVSMLEAMQHGLAIVASDIDGIPEDVTNEESALLIPPGDPAELSKALERLISDAGLRARLGQAARKRYLENHSPQVFIESLRGIYGKFF